MTKQISGIYKIENQVNHNVYIGQSTNILYRWYWHKDKLRTQKHYNEHLQKAWNKYGENNFKFSILETCKSEELNEREMYWDIFYRKDHTLYNIRSTGDQKPMSQEHRDKIGKSLKGKYVGEKNSMYGKHHTEEYKRQMSKKMSGKNAYWYGKHRSDETKEKLRQASLGKKQKPEDLAKRSRPVLQFDLSHRFIREWCSTREASRQLGIRDSSVVQSCKKGYRAGNYYFVYKLPKFKKGD